jgi:hypothetical protein
MISPYLEVASFLATDLLSAAFSPQLQMARTMQQATNNNELNLFIFIAISFCGDTPR